MRVDDEAGNIYQTLCGGDGGAGGSAAYSEAVQVEPMKLAFKAPKLIS
jgi:hypothetical protein